MYSQGFCLTFIFRLSGVCGNIIRFSHDPRAGARSCCGVHRTGKIERSKEERWEDEAECRLIAWDRAAAFGESPFLKPIKTTRGNRRLVLGGRGGSLGVLSTTAAPAPEVWE